MSGVGWIMRISGGMRVGWGGLRRRIHRLLRSLLVFLLLGINIAMVFLIQLATLILKGCCLIRAPWLAA
jgi:hypothetical protein